MCKDNCIFLRARGGRDAEREERALWETPERKRSTKQLSNGRMNSEIDLSSWIWLDLLEMRRHYLGNRGENEGEIQQSENELTGQADPAEEPMEEEPVDDAPPPLEDIEQSEEEDEEEKEEEKEEEETPAPSLAEPSPIAEPTPVADCGMSEKQRYFSTIVSFVFLNNY